MSLGKDNASNPWRTTSLFVSVWLLKWNLILSSEELIFIKLLQRVAVEDINPADDPNNQGEDEFEEAEQAREENLPDENEEQKQNDQKQANAEVEEHLVVSRCHCQWWI